MSDLVTTPAAVAFPPALHGRPIDADIHARRIARAAFGAVLVVGGVGIAVDALMAFPAHAFDLLLGAWCAALAAGALAWLVARVRAAAVDVGRIGDAWLAASYALPLAGLALILPLTIHAVVLHDGAKSFDDWVTWSCALVGHSHITLALMGARRMTRLARGERAMPAAAIYGVVVGTAMIPGVFLMLIPPLVVAATGLPFIFLLWIPEVLMKREKRALE